jgi:hypothetical protein
VPFSRSVPVVTVDEAVPVMAYAKVLSGDWLALRPGSHTAVSRPSAS